jgi:DNA-binding XRE family transcriptional regulator
MQPHQTIDTFGAMLKFLRRRARLTQMELGIAVGYNEAHISRLENGQRLPDLASLAALFVPELDLQDQPEFAARLLELAARTRGKTIPPIKTAHTTTETFDIVGTIESIPPLPPYFIPRVVLAQLGEQLAFQRGLVLCGMAGIGKTTLAAALAHDWAKAQPVFWLTFTTGVTTTVEIVIRQLALFALTQGREQVVPILAQRDTNTSPLALSQVDAAQREWVLLSRSNDPRHYIEQNLVGGWLGRARGDLRAAQDCLHQARERMKVSGYALYAKGVKRLEDALRDPSLPADLRF